MAENICHTVVELKYEWDQIRFQTLFGQNVDLGDIQEIRLLVIWAVVLLFRILVIHYYKLLLSVESFLQMASWVR